jgi:hypothetical protein
MLKSKPVQTILMIVVMCTILLLSMSFFHPGCFIPCENGNNTTSTYDQAPG